MTAKELMLAGEWFDATDTALQKERMRAEELLFRFNNLHSSEEAERGAILNKLLGAMGENGVIKGPFYCDYGYNIRIGDNFFANFNCVMLDGAPITIGNNVLIAPNVSLFTALHPLEVEPRNRWIEKALPITIGNNVWIGGGVVINPGVTIGDDVVIGSGSVVTKDIPSGVVAYGNPCRVRE
ncbi:maltose O-acetyltransferase [Capnocytophaga haemolytica]|jgi:galactoside O-acetyltransferase|uniref:Acetyltransferase n=1 Tax=Capnocytophaga haemolytica TaxID=45243 RepID=A0AAX2GUX4_9FLAO|nr:sugar O-acetyltransferase [Capnocytophaga haemolytica]AMD85256.1 maltose acetyltransferase [Capnocytophaga haemolytica]SFN63085.1 maltose O-acetyltransferase [Capnocytophaga haemolytica]SNV03836.1 Maltose O-acetyltransferase [Capnocytophaga haemolytica]